MPNKPASPTPNCGGRFARRRSLARAAVDVKGTGNAVHKLVSDFIRQRTLSQDMALNEPLHTGIYNLEKSNSTIQQLCMQNEEKLVTQVFWPAMHDIYSRNYEYCCGVVGCFLIGQFPSSEALCRTALEGAVNLHYMSLGDSMSKQIAYFKNHLTTERKQNRTWKESVERSGHPADAKAQHFRAIADKDEALDRYEYILQHSLALDGVDFKVVDLKWPSIFDRFKEIQEEVGYRTVYAALCSQAHSDAEDILNKVSARVIEGVSGMEEAQWVEQYNFSLFLLLTAIDYHIMASGMYLAKFGIDARPLLKFRKKVIEAQTLVTQNSPRHVSERIKVK
jgi:hypothetical protein